MRFKRQDVVKRLFTTLVVVMVAFSFQTTMSGQIAKRYIGPKGQPPDSSWHNPDNWSPNGIPRYYNKVTIPAGCTVTSAGSPMICQDMENNGTISSQPGKEIIINARNVTNEGIIQAGDETIYVHNDEVINEPAGNVTIDAEGYVT
jgi:hypothetical protein